MLLSSIIMVVCICSPVGRFLADGRPVAVMFNLWLLMPQGAHMFAPWPLFAILLLSITTNIFTAFLYKKRMLQVRLLIFSCLLIVGYALAFVALFFTLQNRLNADCQISWPLSLPIVSLILNVLSIKFILKDEHLVRSLDRLR
jgi:hypothetical protein